MTTATTSALYLERTFAAPPDQVFAAWTDPELLKRWWGPHGFSTPAADVDLRAGGCFRIAMKPPQGDVYHLTGAFREVERPQRLVYTWVWDGKFRDGSEMRMPETLVTVEFRACDHGTQVALTHDGFPDQERRDGHEQGWSGCLDRLGDVVGGGDVEMRPPRPS